MGKENQLNTPDILFVAPYSNMPHFIRYQSLALQQIKDSYDFLVLNDAPKEGVSLLSNKNADKEIRAECTKYNALHYKVPQFIHKSVSEGGLVPDGLPASHPSERHRATVNHFFQNYSSILSSWGPRLPWPTAPFWRRTPKPYQIIILMDADILIEKDINFKQILGDHDLAARFNQHKVQQDPSNPNQWWPPQYKHVTEPFTAKWPLPIFLMLNAKKNPNIIHQVNIGGFGGTDTGGLIHFLIEENQLNYKPLRVGAVQEEQIDIGSDSDRRIFVHFRGGSNWDGQSRNYYYEKLFRMFKKYRPTFFSELEDLNKDCDPNSLKSIDYNRSGFKWER